LTAAIQADKGMAMFRHLAINTIASAGAFTAVSIVGFLLIPVLVATYGVKDFGYILLARLFLPTGILVLFDLGFSEIASQSIARARENKAWTEAGADVSVLLSVALGVGATLGFLLLVGAEKLTTLMGAADSPHAGFAAILRATGMTLPFLFAATILEGVVKGYGAFRSLRLIEVGSTLAYGAAALALAKSAFPFETVAYAYLATTLLRGGLVAANAVRVGLGRKCTLAAPDWPAVRRILPRCALMGQSRLLGVLQGPAQQPLIAILIGPTGVAMVEVLAKLPRFCKAALGLLGSALVPLAARLDALNDVKRVGELASWGMLLSSSCAFPPLAGAALLSEPILRLWAGTTFAAYWPWHAMMFVWPMAVAVSGFGSTALIVRPRALAALNRLAAAQLAGQYALALSLRVEFQERAFLLAQAVGVVVALAFALRILVREHHLQAGLLWRILAIFAIGAALATVWSMFVDPRALESWGSTATAFALWCLIYWSAIWVLVLQRSERERIYLLVGSLLALAPADPRSQS
jgi:O-antigen/teichoic acid export membrane protein